MDRPIRQEEVAGYLIEDSVELVEGNYHVRLPGRSLPIRQGESFVTQFVPGWHPTRLYLGFAPLLLLEFVNESGASGVWFLDSRMQHMAGSVDGLPANLRDLLILRAMPILREIMGVFEHDEQFRPGPAAAAFLRLGDHVKHEIGALLAEQLLPRPQSYLASDFRTGQAPIVSPCDGAAEACALSDAFLLAGFEPEWQNKLIETARTGTLRWASPVDGTPLDCRGVVLLDDFHFAYRFVDHRYDLVFYVLVADHRSIVGGVWFPSLGMIICQDERQRPLGNFLAWHLPARIVNHVLSWADELGAYFDIVPTSFSNVLRGNPGVHIGHQLWNELTGINMLVDAVPDSCISHLVIGAGQGLEIYGPIDRIFPTLEGKVVRELPNLPAMIENAYRSGDVVFRVTQDYVTEALRRKLFIHARERATATRIQFPSNPMILFGLRVENRTLVDLGGFLHRLMGMIEKRYPDLVVVFDGHNSSDENAGHRTISSHGESLARVPPSVVEGHLVDQLRASFPQRSHLILDTLMQPVSTSIAWAQASRGFISIWGANLAKYRWVANLPGFVITSAHNLRHRHDLDIYHSTRYMESPTPVEFVDPSRVRDDPNAAQLVPVGGSQPSFFNFHIDENAVLASIDRFIGRVIGQG